MMGLNKFGATITILTAVTLTALAVEILYVLFKRRRRLRPRVRAEPLEPSLPISSSSSPIERQYCESELDEELENHIAKYRSYYGPSRVLFTIKEEEREGVESENGSECSSVVTVKKALAVRNTRMNENVVVVVDGDDEEVVATVEELMSETTPYSTPCATSPYYTPQSSPTRGNG
ncbi:hypothetical protein L195_g039176 [Trifolium pratense]|uniref:Uncharacterized protein n=2 Tax=Trifolium pratense TaxID=57577 RepID=A0ACB0LT29_TRIPR|nr:hypothetical protein L195_g039176 [Trifolium pratense]CAJ2672802.1 unnamed protein product [Trifolium pratense]